MCLLTILYILIVYQSDEICLLTLLYILIVDQLDEMCLLTLIYINSISVRWNVTINTIIYINSVVKSTTSFVDIVMKSQSGLKISNKKKSEMKMQKHNRYM